MITSITVDGFRSLSSFKMTLRPGLNILVGPNGSGKTNVILFFEFLSRITTEPLQQAVSKCGGAGSIFQRSPSGKVPGALFVNTISASIKGEFEYADEAGPRIVNYVYDFTVEISEERDSIFFRFQRVLYSSMLKKSRAKKSWDLDISISWADDGSCSTNVNHIDLRKVAFFSRFIRSDVPVSRSKKVDDISHFVSRNSSPYTNLLLPMTRLGGDVSGVLSDLEGGEAFNIMPSAAREPEDSATPPGVQKDGSGLAATLYALKKAEESHGMFAPRRRTYISHFFRSSYRPASSRAFSPRSNAFDQIVENIRLVNDQILNLDVSLDQGDNKLKIYAEMDFEESNIRLPFSLMSDGTVKWVALVTAIYTYGSIFAIEEPENFIHPLMQKEVVKIMRGAASEKAFKSFVLMTTHSETLLNAAEPEEVLVVSMTRGVTNAKRVKDQRLLRSEISRTGFGLGHYYLAGALDDD